MKKRLIVLPILLSAMLFNTAIAENNVEKQSVKKSKGADAMSVFKRTSPMPLLMGVLVKSGDKLALTKEQNAVFTQWRVNNMASSLQIGNEILDAEKAINQASLEGKSNKEVEEILTAMLDKRHTLASNMLACRDMIIKTLDADQWKKLVTIYNKKSMKMMHAH